MLSLIHRLELILGSLQNRVNKTLSTFHCVLCTLKCKNFELYLPLLNNFLTSLSLKLCLSVWGITKKYFLKNVRFHTLKKTHLIWVYQRKLDRHSWNKIYWPRTYLWLMFDCFSYIMNWCFFQKHIKTKYNTIYTTMQNQVPEMMKQLTLSSWIFSWVILILPPTLSTHEAQKHCSHVVFSERIHK